MPNVVVKRNTDDTMLKKLFGRQMQMAAASSTASLFDEEGPADEPPDYIPAAGISTRRGSRPVRNTPKQPHAEPDGSPAWIANKEAYLHPELKDPRNRVPHPAIKGVPRNIVNNIDHNALTSAPVPPPTQESSIPKEYEHMMPNYMSPNQPPAAGPTVINRPRQFTPEDIPANPPMPPEPPFPRQHSHILPPTEHKTVQPTADMIVKVLGYNETNVKLLGLVSENIARCSKLLADINNSTNPIDVNELMHVLEFMDNTEFRKVLGEAFNKTLQKNIELSALITSYLNGTATIDDGTKKDEDTKSDTSSQDDQSKSDQSLQPGTGADDDTKSDSDAKDTEVDPSTPSTGVTEDGNTSESKTDEPSTTPTTEPTQQETTPTQPTTDTPAETQPQDTTSESNTESTDDVKVN